MSALTFTSAARAVAPAPAADVACAHCGLAVPSGLLAEGREEQFCCGACSTAYHAIRACGLDRYYEYLHAAGASRAEARSTGKQYEEFDDPAFHTLYCVESVEGRKQVVLLIEGMHCAACVWLLERVPTVVPGCIEVRADFGLNTATILFDPSVTPLSRIASCIDRLGYACHPLRERSAREARVRENRAAIMRIGIAGALMGNTMLVALALYGGMFSGMEQAFSEYFRWISAGMGVLAVCWPGSVFLRGAMSSLRMRTPHMDVPIALALCVGLLHGLMNTIRGTGEVYFDTLATLVFLLLIGRWIQQRQQRRAADSVEMLFSMTPAHASLIEGEKVRRVPVEALQPGDIVEVRAGESAPVDGVIIQGRTTLNNSFLTGESRPIEAMVGDRACAGTVILASPIRLRVETTGRATRLGQLLDMVEDHARRKAPIVRLADTLAARFVLVVLALAAATLGVWLFIAADQAIEHAVALLIITCPCALGLATPLAIVVGVGRAARRGILIKGGEAVEVLAGRGVVVLDKTGTLTLGALRVAGYVGANHLKPILAAVEATCSHPAARAIAESWPAAGEHLRVEASHTLGAGIRAQVNDGANDHDVIVGSVRFVLDSLPEASRTLNEELQEGLAQAIASQRTPVLAAFDGVPAALIMLADQPRAEAPEALRALKVLGWRPILLSGDDPRIARSVGIALGFEPQDIEGGVSPEGKAERVRLLAAQGPVVMVGDGVNDAAALAAATAGVAVQGGAEAALGAADAFLSRPGLGPLVELFRGCRSTLKVIRRNLAASLIYNVIFGSLAMTGLVNPLVAAVLMPLSSITVVILSFRTGAFEGETARQPR